MVVEVTDGSYVEHCGHCADERQASASITHIHLDAQLYRPAPLRRSKQMGVRGGQAIAGWLVEVSLGRR